MHSPLVIYVVLAVCWAIAQDGVISGSAYRGSVQHTCKYIYIDTLIEIWSVGYFLYYWTQYNFHNGSHLCCIDSVLIVLRNSGSSWGTGCKIENLISEYRVICKEINFNPVKCLSSACLFVMVLDLHQCYNPSTKLCF